MPQKPQNPVKRFNTEDVVALYLAKVFDRKQIAKIKEIVDFLVGNGESFLYTDQIMLNRVRQLLIKKYEWLGSLRYNRKDFENWMNNIKRNHGKTLEISK